MNDEQQQQEQEVRQGDAVVVSADEPMHDNDIDVEAVANEDSAGVFVHPATSGSAHGDVTVAVVEPADMAQADVGSAHHQVVSLLPASESGTAEADAAAATMVARLSVPSSSCSKDNQNEQGGGAGDSAAAAAAAAAAAVAIGNGGDAGEAERRREGPIVPRVTRSRVKGERENAVMHRWNRKTFKVAPQGTLRA